jgi:hypothetical protein
MIDIYKEVEEIFNDKIESITKYNGQIFQLTENSNSDTAWYDKNASHGDIIKYLEENKLDTEQLQNVLLALVRGLRGHV